MNSRRAFLSAGAAIGAYWCAPLIGQAWQGQEWVSLPGPNGEFKVQRIKAAWPVAHAQTFYAAPSLPGPEAAVWYWQAQIYWQQQQQVAWAARAAWQAQMAAHQWAQETHRRSLELIVAQHPHYNFASRPQPFPYVQSVYALAQSSTGSPMLFGANERGRPVQVESAIRGASRVLNAVHGRVLGALPQFTPQQRLSAAQYAQEEAEKTVGPQTSEIDAKLTLPNNSNLPARGYETKNGVLAVSIEEDFVSSEGKVGAIAKYKTQDGHQYLIV